MLHDVSVLHILLVSFTFMDSNIKKVSDFTSTDDSLFGKFQLYNSVLTVEHIYYGESRNQRKERSMDIQYFQQIQLCYTTNT